MRRANSTRSRRASCWASASGPSVAGAVVTRTTARPGCWTAAWAVPSPKRVPSDDEAEIERLYRTRYRGFTARHFHDLLVRDHLCRWSYTWTKLFLQSKGLLERAPRRGAHRRKRPRRPLPGMMLHQDGSRHAWLAGHAGDGPDRDDG